jgi:hypothetical protein
MSLSLSNPMEDLLNFAYRSYVRMEAEQLIQDCLIREDMEPFNQMVQGLVLNGTPSIALLREVLDEVRSTKSNLSQEGLGVRQDLMDALAEFGVHLPQLLYTDVPDALHQITLQGLREEIEATSKNLSTEDEALLQEIWTEAGTQVIEIARRLGMISSLEEGIRDWIGSLAYEAMRSGDEDQGASQSGIIH